MSDLMTDVIALGCGLVGKFVVTKLCEQGYDVHVVDLQIPKSIKSNPKTSYQEGDIFTIVDSLPKAKVILNLLPGSVGENLRPILIKLGIHIIDLAFTETEPSVHDSLARQYKSRLVWDVGIAPGLSNMIIKREYERDREIKDISIKVGGNPAKPDSGWSYMAPFSPSDVIEEYTRPARIIKEGEVVTVEVLSDLHRISVDNFGEMEAFLTDGLRSLLNTGYAQNMREHTLLGGRATSKSGRKKKTICPIHNLLKHGNLMKLDMNSPGWRFVYHTLTIK